MTSQEIIARINARVYEPKVSYPGLRKTQKFIWDEEKSVRWNREQEVLQEQEYEKMLDAYKQSMNEGYRQFKEDVHSMLESNYGLNETQRSLEFAAAYEEGHSAGFSEVLHYVGEYATFASEIIEAQGN